MQGEQQLSFGPYRVDPAAGQLWRGTQAVKLTPKALAVLRLFLAQPGQVVTKEELLQTVWPRTAVSDAALTSCIQELRRALRDDARKPRYLETVHRRGFRFIGAVRGSESSVRSQRTEPSLHPHASALTLVGRETELRQLYGWWEKALHGERQLVFVTGEPGIGKTTLVEAFLQSPGSRVPPLASGDQASHPRPVQTLDVRRQTLDASLWVGRGQCIEHYGAGEAYLPLLEALGRLCRAPGGEPLIDLLARHAPTWLVQMPALMRAAELEALRRKVAGATKDRMLRELAEALEALTTERPLILWLEDLHWGDYSTLDWLAFVARRQERSRLLVLGTYRPVEVLMRDHPLKAVKQELQMHGQCQELPLDFLREEDVAEYLVRRFAVGAHGRAPFQQPARLIHQRTDGNPLFMVNVVDALVTEGWITTSAGQWGLTEGIEQAVTRMPDSLQQDIEQRLERVNSTERAMLEAASVAGAEFSAAAVAAGVDTTVEAIEVQCAELARRKLLLRVCGTDEWPDGTVATRYGFLHALYQEVLYERLPAGRRQRLHRRIGEREEEGYSERAREIAAELAVHFEQGRDYQRAIRYLQQAGENAIRRSANQEATRLLSRGLELLKTLPDTPERAQQELLLHMALYTPLALIKGFAAPEVEKTLGRAHELCRRLGDLPQLRLVLARLSSVHLTRGEVQAVYELGEQLLTLAQRHQDPAFFLAAYVLLGTSLLFRGELAPARAHWEQVLALYDPQKLYLYSAIQNPAVVGLCYTAIILWMLGYPEQALERSCAALALAQELSHPHNLGFVLAGAILLHQHRQERQTAYERIEALLALCREQGFPYWLAWGTVQQGWALVEQGQAEEGIARMREGLAAWRTIGAAVDRPYLLALLAQGYGKVGQREEGLTVLAEALEMVDKTGQRSGEPELYRLKGELTLRKFKVQGSRFKDAEAEAEACFQQAIAIARRQQAKSWELRAVMSLARLWQQQGRKGEAHKLLADIYGWFTEGFDTKDLQEAKSLLEELS